MAEQILNNCEFDLYQIKKCFIGSRLTNGLPITYPIEYTTIVGSSDSIISIQAFDEYNEHVIIGNQDIQLNKIINTSENVLFSEDMIIDNNGITFYKKLDLIIPNIQLFLINQLVEFTTSSNGQFALSPTIALLIDDNDHQLIVGYDKALFLQNQMIDLGENNAVRLNYLSISASRSRAWELVR